MSTNGNTGITEAEQWRARILRALAELRHHDDSHGQRGDPSGALDRREEERDAGGA